MLSMLRLLAAAAVSSLLASAVLAATPDTPPRRKAALLRWLRAGSYRTAFTPEPGPRESFTAHGRTVRTWLNPVLVEDLRAGRTRFRAGAAMVKELFGGDATTPTGFSVMRKLRDRTDPAGRAWYFFESFDGRSQGAIVGRGNTICTGCHREGVDYLLTPFRP